MDVEILVRLNDSFNSFQYKDVDEPTNNSQGQLIVWRDKTRTKIVAVFNEWVLWRKTPPN